MKSITEIATGNVPSKKQINAALKKSEPDLKKDREKYLDHLAMNKAAQLNSKQTILK